MVKLLKRSLQFFRRRAAEQRLQARMRGFYQNHNIPWSDAYALHKWKSIEETLKSSERLLNFEAASPLPEAFGWRLDERIVEYPWLFSRLRKSETVLKMLDAGSALNYRPIISQILNLKRNLSILTLAPETQAFWRDGISYHYGDLRQLPFRDSWFDEIVSISTLEHVGWDNHLYGAEAASGGTTAVGAAHELWRVLKPNGRLYITVPYGMAEDILINDKIFARQFDKIMLEELLSCFPSAKIETSFYRYEADGWKLSTQDACAEMRYFNVHLGGAFDSDYAAAARAVCCLMIEKAN